MFLTRSCVALFSDRSSAMTVSRSDQSAARRCLGVRAVSGASATYLKITSDAHLARSWIVSKATPRAASHLAPDTRSEWPPKRHMPEASWVSNPRPAAMRVMASTTFPFSAVPPSNVGKTSVPCSAPSPKCFVERSLWSRSA